MIKLVHYSLYLNWIQDGTDSISESCLKTIYKIIFLFYNNFSFFSYILITFLVFHFLNRKDMFIFFLNFFVCFLIVSLFHYLYFTVIMTVEGLRFFEYLSTSCHMFCLILGFSFWKYFLRTLITILWKSDSPVVITVVFWKLVLEFVTKRSMQLGLFLLLKHVFSLTRYEKSLQFRNSDKHDSVSSAFIGEVRCLFITLKI